MVNQLARLPLFSANWRPFNAKAFPKYVLSHSSMEESSSINVLMSCAVATNASLSAVIRTVGPIYISEHCIACAWQRKSIEDKKHQRLDDCPNRAHSARPLPRHLESAPFWGSLWFVEIEHLPPHVDPEVSHLARSVTCVVCPPFQSAARITLNCHLSPPWIASHLPLTPL